MEIDVSFHFLGDQIYKLYNVPLTKNKHVNQVMLDK